MDLKSLPIGPEEAFVLSRIDGHSSEQDIAAATGLGAARVTLALARLTELGAIRFPASSAEGPHRTNSGTHRLDTSYHQQPTSPIEEAAGPSRVPVRPSPSPARSTPTPAPAPTPSGVPVARSAPPEPVELEAGIDVDPDRQRLILETFRRLETASHYELLGVDQTADKKAIKDAYFQSVAVFHPDRYFGKNLGSLKAKLEKVFARITEAQDVLTRKGSRAEYDEYLTTQRQTRDLERQLHDDSVVAAELESVERLIRRQAGTTPSQANLQAVTAPGPLILPSEPRIETMPEPAPDSGPARPSDRPSAVPRSVDPDARRKALLRKLAGRSTTPPPPRSTPPSPPSDPTALRDAAADDLRRRYDERLSQAKRAQIQRYVDVAEQALRERKVVAAANALRIAVTLAPDDLSLVTRYEEVQRTAGAELSVTYTNQAHYEERNGHFLEAARSYARAAAGQPSARLHERAAHCFVEADVEPRSAVDHARKALALAPDDAGVRLTLGRAYLASDMRQSAIAELERAQALAPGDETIKDWLSRAKRHRT